MRSAAAAVAAAVEDVTVVDAAAVVVAAAAAAAAAAAVVDAAAAAQRISLRLGGWCWLAGSPTRPRQLVVCRAPGQVTASDWGSE
jgi:hypothetical protein